MEMKTFILGNKRYEINDSKVGEICSIHGHEKCAQVCFEIWRCRLDSTVLGRNQWQALVNTVMRSEVP
jgi:hypothetical protein